MTTAQDFICLLLSAFLLFIAVEVSSEIRESNSLRVIDGDTFEFKGVKIRIRGVDTPELKTKSKIEKQLALEAKCELERLLRQGFKYVETNKDKYGRTVADVFVGSQNVAESLIKSGHGRAYLMRLPKQRQQELLKLESTAKKDKLGIWQYKIKK